MKEEKNIKWKLFRGLVDIFVLAGSIILVSYILAIIFLGVR